FSTPTEHTGVLLCLPNKCCTNPGAVSRSHHMVLMVPLRVAQVPDQELLCQADVALTKVTRCRETYEPLIINLKRLHGKKNCFLSDENEIYLRHFLPALGNFTQGLYRRRGSSAAQ
uniref:Interleukin-4 n=1 Tax=Taeniopygia guttata TaxID=59729 RepID=A0A674G6W7_TAEGU